MLAKLDPSVAIGPQLYRALRQAIVSLAFTPGQALSEKEIAERFGISRQPVREAFIKLAEARLVRVLPQRGTFVIKISLRDVANGRLVREAVETTVARTACRVASPEAIAALRRTIDRQREAAAGDDQHGFLAEDEALHRLLADSIDCPDAWLKIEDIKAQMDRVRFLSLPEASPMSLLIDQHVAIVDAIAARDPDAAEAAMRRHLSEILVALPLLARAAPDLFEEDELPAHAIDLVRAMALESSGSAV